MYFLTTIHVLSGLEHTCAFQCGALGWGNNACINKPQLLLPHPHAHTQCNDHCVQITVW